MLPSTLPFSLFPYPFIFYLWFCFCLECSSNKNKIVEQGINQNHTSGILPIIFSFFCAFSPINMHYTKSLFYVSVSPIYTQLEGTLNLIHGSIAKDRMKFFTKTQQRTLPDHQTKETRKVLFYDQIFYYCIFNITPQQTTHLCACTSTFFLESSRKHQCTHKRQNNAAVKTFIFSC